MTQITEGSLTYAPNFKFSDFTCRCSVCSPRSATQPATKREVIEALQSLRDALGEPLVVTRGVSCKAHNAEVGGARDSRHLPEHADAVDLACTDSAKAFRIIQHAISLGDFTVIRVYEKHVHLDCRSGPRRFLASPE